MHGNSVWAACLCMLLAAVANPWVHMMLASTELLLQARYYPQLLLV